MLLRPGVRATASAVALLVGAASLVGATQRRQAALEFDVSHQVAGRLGGRLRVLFTLHMAKEQLSRAVVGGVEVLQLSLRGEVSHDQAVVDSFEYSFTVPADSDQLPVVIERELRPGTYELRLEAADRNSRRRGERRISLEVVVPESLVLAPTEEGRESDEEMARRLLLVPPGGEALAGLQPFTAVVVGEVARVEFLLDGQPVMIRNRPPYQATIDLGPLPRRATITAVARDAAGQEVDRVQLVVNQGRERFVVRFEPISPADRRDDRLRLRATVQVPSEHRLGRVEFFLDDTQVGQLEAPPFEVWVATGERTGVARVVATLNDGTQGEDVIFLDSATFLSSVRVDAVELPVTVLGEGGRPVEGLEISDFEVFEDGVPQRLTHLARHADVPLRVGLVVDTSGSMEKTLPEVQRVAMEFLRRLLRPTDRAFVVAFSDRPALLEPMTRDFEALQRSLLALRAERLTALYDAMVFSLFQFSGVRGRRALVVLTDGEDNASRHTFEQVIELAARTSATVYTIGVDLSVQQLRARAGLQRLARSTGGEAFFVASGGALERVYSRIERDLRSQYLLAYTSSSSSPPGSWRSIEVRVRRPGVEIRTLAGYVPE